MKEKIRADKELAQEMINTEKSKQRSFNADADYKDAIRETEDLLRSGKYKLQTREIMKVVYETFGQDLSNARQIEEIARLMTATDRPSSIPAYLDKIAEQIGGSDQDAKWEAKARLSENLRKLLKSYDDQSSLLASCHRLWASGSCIFILLNTAFAANSCYHSLA